MVANELVHNSHRFYPQFIPYYPQRAVEKCCAMNITLVYNDEWVINSLVDNLVETCGLDERGVHR